MCLGYGYECSYRSAPRSRRSQRCESRSQNVVAQEENTTTSTLAPSQQPLPEGQQQYTRLAERPNSEHSSEQQSQGFHSVHLRPVQVNSGAAFVGLLTTTLESNPSISAMRMLAWNLFLGERESNTLLSPGSITDILTEVGMQNLAAVYFAKFHRCYGFVDRTMLADSIAGVWAGHLKSHLHVAVLCGVAAIGSLFSDSTELLSEQQLVALAKRLLDPSTAGPPNSLLSAAWVLRTVYLRLTAKPEEAWQASCTTLHVIDATDFTSTGRSTDTHLLGLNHENEASWKSLVGVAQHVNIWLSYDLGRNRVVLAHPYASPIPVREDEYTSELLGLLPYSEVLDPANKLSSESLLLTLVEVLDRNHTEPPSVLGQCNLVLCIYRRLHSTSQYLSDGLKDKFFRQMRKSIQAVHSAIAQGLPWHHVANIPFQILCILLYIDTAQSFAILGEAQSCVVAVNNAYQTEATREAATAAHTLVQLHRRRREAEIKTHTDMLHLYPVMDLHAQDFQDDLLCGDALQDSWWFNQFIAHADFSGPSGHFPSPV